jgi:hypothetical protein
LLGGQIPTDFVEEVRLPPAKYEDDDDFMPDGPIEWGKLFVDGKVPDEVICELDFPGLGEHLEGVSGAVVKGRSERGAANKWRVVSC